MKTKLILTTTLVLVYLLVGIANAQIPKQINYQGRLTDPAGKPLDGEFDMTFAIYDESGGRKWNETQSVKVQKGLFSVLLGSVTPLELSFDGPYRLGIQVNGDPEMIPRKPIVSVGYAFRAENANNADYLDGMDSAEFVLLDGLWDILQGLTQLWEKVEGLIAEALTNYVEKGEQDSVTSGMIVDETIQERDLSSNSVSTAKIQNNAVTSPKIADLAVTTSKIDNNAVTTAKLQDAVATNAKLAADSVTRDKIRDGEVISADIADGTVTGTDIANGTVATEDIADNAITSAKIQDGQVTSADIKDGTIQQVDIASGVIPTSVNGMSGGTITSSVTVNGGVTSNGNMTVNGSITSSGSVTSSGIEVIRSSVPSIFLKNSGYSKWWTMLVEDGSGMFIISDITEGNNQRLFINSSGNVGIGTRNPSHKLHVYADSGNGVYGESSNGNGVYGRGAGSDKAGVYGDGSRYGVYGVSDSADGCGIYGKNPNGAGVAAESINGPAVTALSYHGYGVLGQSLDTYGVASKGKKGMIIPTGTSYDVGAADVAEYFPVNDIDLEPGDVVVIAPSGGARLMRSTKAYDTCVAGIISTAPGMKLGVKDGELNPGSNDGEKLIAVAGRVPCKVDANYAPIKPGDLLTTSNTPGHAMKATDPKIGTILGKALDELSFGRGVIEVLVTLQ